MIVIKLAPEDLTLLREEKRLPKNHGFTLKKGEVYGFYHRSYLYGLYQLRAENPRHYFLSKNYFRPLRLLGNESSQKKFLSAPPWLIQTWKARNQLHDRLLLLCDEDEKNYFFNFFHHHLPGFKKSLSLPKTPETSQLISDSVKILSSTNPHTLKDLKAIGGRLFELAGLKEITPLLSRRITYSPAPPQWPIEIFYDTPNEKFVWRENPIVYYRSNSPRRQLHSFTCLDTGEDRFMTAERQSLQDAFKLKPNFSSQFITGNSRSLFRNLFLEAMEADILHLICHGRATLDDFSFIHNEIPLLTLAEINRLPRTPPLVFLSNCYSDHPPLVKAFLGRGTQTLITSQGPLFSENLPEALGSFYRRMLSEKLSVIGSYHLLIKRLIPGKNINAIKLRLYGYGQEKLFSFKTR